MPPDPPTAASLRAAFDAPAPLTVGLEEELMLLDPATHDLAPVAPAVLARLEGDPRIKLELPASQLEIVTPPARTVPEAVATLREGRRAIAAAAAATGLARPAAAGVHPFAAAEGALNPGERYERTLREYGRIARRQLVCALQVHVAVGSADAALAVYNALRSYLPELAALAANAPFHAGRDTGLASVRPMLCQELPRQGVPPVLPSWEAFAATLAWGERSGAVPEPRVWWWELRPHPAHGTLEVRVPDAQTTLGDAAGVAAVAQALVAWLAARHAAGEGLPVAETWRIEENRWSACRHGLDGSLADLATGERRPTRECLAALLDVLAPVAAGLGAAHELDGARALVEANGAARQRAVAAAEGLVGVAAWLAQRYGGGEPGRADSA
jgi:carboxylate-amine ligase